MSFSPILKVNSDPETVKVNSDPETVKVNSNPETVMVGIHIQSSPSISRLQKGTSWAGEVSENGQHSYRWEAKPGMDKTVGFPSR